MKSTGSAGKVLLGMAVMGIAGLSNAAVASADEQGVHRQTEIGVVNAGPSEVRGSDVGTTFSGAAADVRAAEINESWSSIGEARYHPFHEPVMCAEVWNPGDIHTSAVGDGLDIPGMPTNTC